MKCSYHPTADSQDFCTTCSKPLCVDCAHQIKGKAYCQDCLIRGAEWASKVKDLRIPADSPKRAALCSLIPGMGAVYNSQYLKAVTFFAVFSALVMMGDDVHPIFGFGAFAFLIFTIFDSYRTAEMRSRARLQRSTPPELTGKDRSVIAWGVFLIVLGTLIMLKNFIPYYIVRQYWPAMFIILGAYLVWRALQERDEVRDSDHVLTEKKEF